MADDRTNHRTQDRSRVNINEDYELRYRSGKLDVNPKQVKAAVAKVGPSTDAIAPQLGKQV